LRSETNPCGIERAQIWVPVVGSGQEGLSRCSFARSQAEINRESPGATCIRLTRQASTVGICVKWHQVERGQLEVNRGRAVEDHTVRLLVPARRVLKYSSRSGRLIVSRWWEKRSSGWREFLLISCSRFRGREIPARGCQPRAVDSGSATIF